MSLRNPSWRERTTPVQRKLELGVMHRCGVCGEEAVIYEWNVGYFCGDHLKPEERDDVE